MIQLKTMREFNSSNITAKDACRIFSSNKPYLVKVEDEIHLTKDFQGLITRLYPAVAPELVEVFVLNNE
jgi:hypothetical protein